MAHNLKQSLIMALDTGPRPSQYIPQHQGEGTNFSHFMILSEWLGHQSFGGNYSYILSIISIMWKQLLHHCLCILVFSCLIWYLNFGISLIFLKVFLSYNCAFTCQFLLQYLGPNLVSAPTSWSCLCLVQFLHVEPWRSQCCGFSVVMHTHVSARFHTHFVVIT